MTRSTESILANTAASPARRPKTTSRRTRPVESSTAVSGETRALRARKWTVRPVAGAPCTVRARKINESFSALPTGPYGEAIGRKPVFTPERPAGAEISKSTGARPRTRTCTLPPRETEFAINVKVARPAESVTPVSGARMPPFISTPSPDTGFPRESVTTATMMVVVSPPRNAT